MEEKRKLASQLAFIHQCLTQKNQYFVEEFDIAKDAIKTITNMFNTINDELKAAAEAAPIPQVATEAASE